MPDFLVDLEVLDHMSAHIPFYQIMYVALKCDLTGSLQIQEFVSLHSD